MNQDAERRNAKRRILWVRCKQTFAVGFVILTTTILIQNIAYPEFVTPWKKSFRALVGGLLFFLGFTVARVLFDLYREEIAGLRKAVLNDPPREYETVSGDGMDATLPMTPKPDASSAEEPAHDRGGMH